jgi:hypothetical protein
LAALVEPTAPEDEGLIALAPGLLERIERLVDELERDDELPDVGERHDPASPGAAGGTRPSAAATSGGSP